MKKNVFLVALLVLTCFVGAYAQQPNRYTPIDSVQFGMRSKLINDIDSPAYYKIGDSVTVEGIIQLDARWYGLSSNRRAAWIQTDTNSWNGIQVMLDRNPGNKYGRTWNFVDLKTYDAFMKFSDNMKPGFKVRVTGIVDQFANETQILLLPIEVEPISTGNTQPKARVVVLDSLIKNDGNNSPNYASGEKYEGMLVELRNVAVVDRASFSSGQRWNWSLQSANGLKIATRDISRFFRNDQLSLDTLKNYDADKYIPQSGTVLQWIRGIVVQFSLNGVTNYAIAPRDTNDIGPSSFALPRITGVYKTPTPVKSTDDVTINATITNLGDVIASATVKYSTDGGANWSSSMMTQVGTTNAWMGTIPKQADGTTISYYIVATNGNSRSDSMRTPFRYKVKDAGISKIADLHESFVPNGPSIYAFDTLKNASIKGVVMSKFRDGVAFTIVHIQDGTGMNAGIQLRDSVTKAINNLNIGDSVVISSCVVRDNFNINTLSNLSFNKVGTANPYPAIKDTAILNGLIRRDVTTGKSYQSMLVEFTNPVVSNPKPDGASNFGEWAIAFDTLSQGIRVDDLASDITDKFVSDTLYKGYKFTYMRAVVWYSFGNWKLLPRNQSDLGLVTSLTDKINPELINSRIYPNPSNGILNIYSSAPQVMTIYDLNGKVVLQSNILSGTQQFLLSEIPNGIYTLRLQSQGANPEVKKLIINR